jgi:hypothetical protein
MADSVFAPNCNQPDGQHRIEHQPNLHNLGIPLKNPHAPVAPNGNEIVKGDFLWVKPNGDRCIIDATSTAVCRTSVYTDARVSTVPGTQADIAARNKRTKYTAKYDWPADIPLLIPAFETSGRWSTDATTLIEKFRVSPAGSRATATFRATPPATPPPSTTRGSASPWHHASA